MKKAILLLLFLLSLSICLNLFQWSNAAVTCDNIDAHWKVGLLYFLGHNHLDGDKDGIPWIVASPYTSIYPPTTTTASNG